VLLNFQPFFFVGFVLVKELALIPADKGDYTWDLPVNPVFERVTKISQKPVVSELLSEFI
jgi:hypothetical protein